MGLFGTADTRGWTQIIEPPRLRREFSRMPPRSPRKAAKGILGSFGAAFGGDSREVRVER